MDLTNGNRPEIQDKAYIFLDIDGVMATSNQYLTNRKKWHPTYDCYRFDEKCVKVFNQITEKINPIIILSSDWKFHYDIKKLQDIFEWNNVISRISDITTNLWGVKYYSSIELEECRAMEILEYVKEMNIINWVAVDDLNLNLWISDNFVHCTRSYEGIKQVGIKEKIFKTLNK